MSAISSRIPTLFIKKSSFPFYNAINVRTLKSALKIKWVRPVKKPFIHPSNTGDIKSITKYRPSQVLLGFEKSVELKTADENVKKIFQLDLNNAVSKLQLYRKELSDLVRRHPYDINSHEVFIARMTATIRFFQEHMEKFPKDVKNKVRLHHCIDRRKRLLTHLRRWDYKRFEWILEKLNIVYRPYPNVYDQITRKKSLTALTTLHCEGIKEKKIAEYRQKMNELKIPFLENKLSKLKWIQKEEAKYQMEKTVSDEDIKECSDQLEKVKMEVEAMKNKNLVRTIDPYSLEVYDAEALREAEENSASTA